MIPLGRTGFGRYNLPRYIEGITEPSELVLDWYLGTGETHTTSTNQIHLPQPAPAILMLLVYLEGLVSR